MNTIGDKIRGLRKKAGLSQEELGYELGVSRQAISKWEMGKSIPGTENLIALSEFFDVDISYFLHAVDMNEMNMTGTYEMSDKAINTNDQIDQEAISVRKVLRRTNIIMILLIIFAIVFAGISIYTGILAFSLPIEGDFELVYFSEFNINIFDVFIISTVLFGALVIGIAVTAIIKVKQNKKLKIKEIKKC